MLSFQKVPSAPCPAPRQQGQGQGGALATSPRQGASRLAADGPRRPCFPAPVPRARGGLSSSGLTILGCKDRGWCRWEASGPTVSGPRLRDVSLGLQVSAKVVIAQTTDRGSEPTGGHRRWGRSGSLQGAGCGEGEHAWEDSAASGLLQSLLRR